MTSVPSANPKQTFSRVASKPSRLASKTRSKASKSSYQATTIVSTICSFLIMTFWKSSWTDPTSSRGQESSLLCLPRPNTWLRMRPSFTLFSGCTPTTPYLETRPCDSSTVRTFRCSTLTCFPIAKVSSVCWSQTISEFRCIRASSFRLSLTSLLSSTSSLFRPSWS